MKRSSSSSFQHILQIEHGCALRSSSGARGLEIGEVGVVASDWRQKRYVDEQVRSQRKERRTSPADRVGAQSPFLFYHQTSGRLITRMVPFDLKRWQHSFFLYALAVPASPIALILAQGCSCPKLCSRLLTDSHTNSTTASTARPHSTKIS
jgi:hypothetical protein